MKPSAIIPFGSLLVLLAATFAANRVEGEEGSAARSPAPAMGKHKLVAVMRPEGNGDVQGSVLLEKIAGGVRVAARIGGLRPDSVHAIRLQGIPEVHTSSGSSRDVLQPGDLGNLMSDENGNAIHVVDLDARVFGKSGIVGLTITVHENAGNGELGDEGAGHPIGSGVILAVK